MISLEKYNDLVDYKRKNKNRTGIVCPSCEVGELLYKDPGEPTTSRYRM